MHRPRRSGEEGPVAYLKRVKIRLDLTPGNRAYGTLRQRCNKHDPWFTGTSPPLMKDLSLVGFQSLCLLYVSLDLTCSRDRHAFHPRSFRTFSFIHYITRTSALLEPKIEVFFISMYSGGRKLLCLGLGDFHLLLQHTRYRAFLLL